MASGFCEAIGQSFPQGLSLPESFVTVFDWMASHGHVGCDTSGQVFGAFEPLDGQRTCRCAVMPAKGVDPAHPGWPGDPDVMRRLALFMRTGGDGSRAGIWCDDTGRQHFIHLGSGSGSTLACVLTDDPIDMLRLFAIGYEEICWPEDHPLTPEAARVASGGDRPLPDVSAYADCLVQAFGVTIPRTASEIVRHVAKLGDATSDDPFWRWFTRISR